MENLFNNFSPINAEVKSANGMNEYTQLHYSADLTITKGNFSQNISFRTNIYSVEFADKKYLQMEDFDYDIYRSTLGDLPIDSIYAFTKGLRDNGLTTLADSLNITWEDVRLECAKMINNSESVKAVHGNASVFSSLPKEEQKLIKLDHLIMFYDIVAIRMYKDLEVPTKDESGIPSLAEVKDYRKKLSN
jgi:hypothetical protein